MSARLTAAALLLAFSGSAALAQSYNAPAGIPPALAPGGLEGRAAIANFLDARDAPARYADPRLSDDLATGSLGHTRTLRGYPQR
ncbi:hypothetical protein [Methylobacterium sp. A54F]